MANWAGSSGPALQELCCAPRAAPIPLLTVRSYWASWRAWLGAAPHTTFFVVLWGFHSVSSLFTINQSAVVANYRGRRANACDHQKAHQWHSTNRVVPAGSHWPLGAFGAFTISVLYVMAGFRSRNSLRGQTTPQALHWLWKHQVGTSIARKACGCGVFSSELP